MRPFLLLCLLTAGCGSASPETSSLPSTPSLAAVPASTPTVSEFEALHEQCINPNQDAINERFKGCSDEDCHHRQQNASVHLGIQWMLMSELYEKEQDLEVIRKNIPTCAWAAGIETEAIPMTGNPLEE